MNISIITAVCGAIDITQQWIEETLGTCMAHKHEVIIVSNGNTEAENRQLEEMFEETDFIFTIVTHEKPLGSTKAFNLGAKHANGDLLVMLHNDLMVRQDGWDLMVESFFRQAGQHVGVVGFHGSKMLGHPQIYQIPYELVQLARNDSYSNMEDAESHGQRVSRPMPVVTVDGMALICQRADFEAWGGLDERYPHHMYDHDLCLTARQHGRVNWMLPISVRHISGQTANADRYNQEFSDSGRDQGVHKQAHVDFYEKWRGTLPARV